MRGMVVGEGGRSSGVLLYHAGGSHASGTYCTLVGVSRLSVMFIFCNGI